MKQLVYKLNLPPLEECILDGTLERYFPDDNKNSYNLVKAADLFKSEYLNMGSFQFNRVLIFYTNDITTPKTIHTDTNYPKYITEWGINWIYKNDGILEFWDFEKIEKENITYVSDKHQYSTFHYNPTTLSDITYQMPPGPYLVNASVPHRASSYRSRYCASLRSTVNTLSWDSIVYQFKDFIDYDFSAVN